MCWLCVDAELAIGQYRLGVHGTCGLNNPWHHLWKISSLVGNPGRPPYVIPRGSAELKKKLAPDVQTKNWNYDERGKKEKKLFISVCLNVSL